MSRVAIVGAGVTGLSLALHLPQTANITIFDKSRRAGGRVSTRSSRQHPGYFFDHGASFIPSTGEFAEYLRQIDAVQQLSLNFAPRLDADVVIKKMLSGKPRVESIAEKMLENVQSLHKEATICFETRIVEIVEEQGKMLSLKDQNQKNFGPFTEVFVCIPYPQCQGLRQKIIALPTHNESQYFPSWVVLVAIKSDSPMADKLNNLDILGEVGGNIQSMVNQRSKELKTDDSLYVFSMKREWAQQNRDLKPKEVEIQFARSLESILGFKIEFQYLQAHRWLYSEPRNPPNKIFNSSNVFMGADWAQEGGNVQVCWQVGKKLASAFGSKTASL